MNQSFEKYVHRDVIYFERGFVALCKIKIASRNEDNVYSFDLRVLRCYQDRSLGCVSDTQHDDLEIAPEFSAASDSVCEENGQIIASGYIFWTIVLDPEMIRAIIETIHKAEGLVEPGDWVTEPYGICRAVTDEHFRKRLHPGLLSPRQ